MSRFDRCRLLLADLGSVDVAAFISARGARGDPIRQLPCRSVPELAVAHCRCGACPPSCTPTARPRNWAHVEIAVASAASLIIVAPSRARSLRVAGVVELVDAPDLKSGSERSVGSIPTARTSLSEICTRYLCIRLSDFFRQLESIGMPLRQPDFLWRAGGDECEADGLPGWHSLALRHQLGRIGEISFAPRIVARKRGPLAPLSV